MHHLLKSNCMYRRPDTIPDYVSNDLKKHYARWLVRHHVIHLLHVRIASVLYGLPPILLKELRQVMLTN